MHKLETSQTRFWMIYILLCLSCSIFIKTTSVSQEQEITVSLHQHFIRHAISCTLFCFESLNLDHRCSSLLCFLLETAKPGQDKRTGRTKSHCINYTANRTSAERHKRNTFLFEHCKRKKEEMTIGKNISSVSGIEKHLHIMGMSHAWNHIVMYGRLCFNPAWYVHITVCICTCQCWIGNWSQKQFLGKVHPINLQKYQCINLRRLALQWNIFT